MKPYRFEASRGQHGQDGARKNVGINQCNSLLYPLHPSSSSPSPRASPSPNLKKDRPYCISKFQYGLYILGFGLGLARGLGLEKDYYYVNLIYMLYKQQL